MSTLEELISDDNKIDIRDVQSILKVQVCNLKIDKNQQFLKLGTNINKLFYGDNLEILRRYIVGESVDLIYLDPPFNSKADYNILFKEPSGEQSTAQIQAFSDSWHWDDAARQSYEYLTGNDVDVKVANLAEALYRVLGKNDMTAYLFMMANRLIELHRVLKPTGSLFLHCDPTASHYLKLMLDAIFGASNFRNEIIWRRTGSHNKINRYAPIHDVILFYSKTEKYKWKSPKRPYMKGHIDEYFIKDKDGYKTNYYGNVLTGSGIRGGDSGKPWRGFNPTEKNRHWAIPKAVLDDIDEDLSNLTTQQKLDRLFELSYVKIIPDQSLPIYERHLKSDDGQPLSDIWAFQPYTNGTVFGTDEGIDEDVRWLSTRDKERLGYQTQKPVALLKRIIESTTDKGDWVLDPFCGCGTAIAASEEIDRHWIGIDITWLAINLVKNRLKAVFPHSNFELEGEPKDIGAAIELSKDRYQFQWWALSLIHARPVGSKPSNPREGKKGADEGVDGWLRFRIDKELETIVIQVKSGHVGVDKIRELRDTVTRQKAAMGIFITLEEPTSEMIKEVKATDPYVAKSLNMEFPKIQILTIKELLDGVKPKIPQTASAFPEAVITKRVSGKDSSTLDDFAEE